MSKWAQGLAWSGPLVIEPSSLNQVYVKGKKEWMCDLESLCGWYLIVGFYTVVDLKASACFGER